MRNEEFGIGERSGAMKLSQKGSKTKGMMTETGPHRSILKGSCSVLVEDL